MRPDTLMKDTQVHASGLSVLHFEVGSHTCLRSPELAHSLLCSRAEALNLRQFLMLTTWSLQEGGSIGDGGGSGQNRERACWPTA